MSSADRLEPGTLIAQDYRVVRHLAEGGFGAVYVVEQLSTRKQRALKVLRVQIAADRANVDRFVREATVGSTIESDHVVEAIAAGIDVSTGLPWIAMELLDGLDLASLIARRGALDPPDVLEICRQLCHALAAAHDAGVVHRDLKPENVFVARARRADVPFTVKLLDFGIAKVLEDVSQSPLPVADMSTQRSSTMHVVGSPLWMAPEQIKLSPVGPATDVWALGLLAFWMLTGRAYWRSAHAASFAFEALVAEKLFEPIEVASVRAAQIGVAGRVPPEFDGWFAQCVDRDPALRFSSARGAFEALSSVLAGATPSGERPKPVSLLPPSFTPTRTGTPQALPPGALAPTPGAIAAARPGTETPMAGAFQPTLRSSPPIATNAPGASGRRRRTIALVAGVAVLSAAGIYTTARIVRSNVGDTVTTRAASPAGTLPGSNVHAVGENWRLGAFEYRVDSVEARDELRGSIGAEPARAAAGSVFIVVRFVETNRGASPYTGLAGLVRLHDARGRTLQPSPRAAPVLALSDPGFDLILTELRPGIPHPTVLAFEVARDAIAPTVDVVFEERGVTSNTLGSVRAAPREATGPLFPSASAVAATAPPPVSPPPPSYPAAATMPAADAGATSGVAVPAGSGVHTIGQRWSLGGFTYRVTRVRVSREFHRGSENEVAARGSTFVFVEFDETNDGNSVAMGLTDNVRLRDARGTEHRMATRVQNAIALGSGHPEEMIAASFQPHVPHPSVAGFEIPEDMARAEMELHFEQRGMMNDSVARVRVAPSEVQRER